MKKITANHVRIVAFLAGLAMLFVRFRMPSRYLIPKEIQIIYGILLLVGVLVMAEIDIRTRQIPHSIQLYFLVLGFGRVIYDWSNVGNYLLAGFLMGALLLLIAVLSRGRLGGGDIKLMALAGLCLGLRDVFLALAIASVFASVIGLSLIAVGKIGSKTPIPFGPFLGAGIYLAYLFGKWIW